MRHDTLGMHNAVCYFYCRKVKKTLNQQSYVTTVRMRPYELWYLIQQGTI